MIKIDQIISPKWILTSKNQNPKKNQSIVISGNKIHDILDSNDVKKKYSTEKHIKLPNHILLPGLINPYSELSQQLTDEIISYKSKENFNKDKDKTSYSYYLDFATKLIAIKIIKSGTTSYTNVSYYPNIVIDIFSQIGIRLFCGLPMFGNQNTWSNNEEDCFKKNLAVYDKYKSYTNTKMFFCLFVSDPVSHSMLVKLANVANELELPIVLVNNSIKSLDNIKNIFEPLIELNVVNKNFTCVNFPLNNYVSSLIDKYSINLVLSDITERILKDKVKRNNISIYIKDYSINMDISLMRNVEHVFLRNKYNLNISELSTLFFEIINNNAAKVVSEDNNIGELEINKSADMISINIDRFDLIKRNVMNLHFFDSKQCNMIDNVWIAGKHIYKNRKLVTINEYILYDEIEYLNGSK